MRNFRTSQQLAANRRHRLIAVAETDVRVRYRAPVAALDGEQVAFSQTIAIPGANPAMCGVSSCSRQPLARLSRFQVRISGQIRDTVCFYRWPRVAGFGSWSSVDEWAGKDSNLRPTDYEAEE